MVEVAASMPSTECHMNIGHVPREGSIWAYDLANLQFDGRDLRRRWVPIEELRSTLVCGDLFIYSR